jgi:heme exporter protein C
MPVTDNQLSADPTPGAPSVDRRRRPGRPEDRAERQGPPEQSSSPSLSESSAPSLRNPTGTRFTRVLGVATLVSMAVLVVFGLFLSPADDVQSDSVRILYIHVGTVWVAYVAFAMTALASAAFLWKRTSSLTWDRIAGASAEVGVLFMALTLFAGAIWGRLAWGKFWVWDARVTTTAFLFITYIGYLAVRGLGGSHQQRARRSAVVALLAVLEIPLVHFSVKLWRGLHQDSSVADTTDVKLHGLMLFSLFTALVAFSLLYAWMVIHRQRVLFMQDALDDKGLDYALAQRRLENDVDEPLASAVTRPEASVPVQAGTANEQGGR